jgi:hypothetical protein
VRTRSITLPGMLLLTVASCGEAVFDVYTCKDPFKDHVSKDYGPDPCHYHDCNLCAAMGPNVDAQACWASCSSRCEDKGGICIPEGDDNWSEPLLFWSGLSTEVPPSCPGGQENEQKVYHADPISPSKCTCTCEPPEDGVCSLPSKLTASTALCHEPSGTSIPLDAPASWDGACTPAKAIPANAGIKSLTIPPLTITEGDCSPISVVPDPPPLTWQKTTRTCQLPLIPSGKCDTGKICMMKPTWSPLDFQLCIAISGDESCPQHYEAPQPVFYKTEKLQDDRRCAPCTCGSKPTGSKCTAQVSVYQDNACGTTPIIPFPVSSGGSQCLESVDVPFPDPGSMSAKPPMYTAGICSGSSSISGEVDLKDDNAKIKYCCRYDTIEPPR